MRQDCNQLDFTIRTSLHQYPPASVVSRVHVRRLSAAMRTHDERWENVRMLELTFLHCPACPGEVLGFHNAWTFSAINPVSIRQHRLFINPNNGKVIFNGWD